MSIKGYPSQKKSLGAIPPYTAKQTQTTSEFNTLQDIGSDKIAMDVANKYAFRLSAIDAAEAGSTTRILKATAHGAVKGDFIRFESGPNQYFEAGVLSVPDVNTIILSTELPSTIGVGNTFYVLKYITPRVDSSGNQIVTAVFAPTYLTYKQSARLDYASTNVDDTNWTQLIASTTAETKKCTMFDGGGYAMELGIGAAASEARILLIPPGGLNGMIDLVIPVGSRLSVRAIGAVLVSAGELDLNLMGE